MPVLFPLEGVTVPQPLEPDIEIERRTSNRSLFLRLPSGLDHSQHGPPGSGPPSLNRTWTANLTDLVDDPAWAVSGGGMISHDMVFYAFPLMIVCGIVSQTICIVTLVRAPCRTSNDVYLLWFVSCGFLLLIAGGLLKLPDYLPEHSNTYQYFHGYIWSVNEWLWYSSLWILLMMTLEKALMPRRTHPSHASHQRGIATPTSGSMVNSGRSVFLQTSVVCLVVSSVCLVSALPHFFEFELTTSYDYFSNRTLVISQLCDEAHSFEYVTVYFWYVVTLTVFLPLPILLLIVGMLVRGLVGRQKTVSSANGTATYQTGNYSKGSGSIIKTSGPGSSNGICKTSLCNHGNAANSRMTNGMLSHKAAEEDNISRLFIALILLYLILTGPLTSVNYTHLELTPNWTWSVQTDLVSMVYPLCEFCFYSYFATIFPLLCSYSDKFLTTLTRYCCCCCPGNNKDKRRSKSHKTVKFNAHTIEIEIS